jgi:hypothetical protein
VSLRAYPRAKDVTVFSVGTSTRGACQTPSTKSEPTKEADCAIAAPDHHAEIIPLIDNVLDDLAPGTMPPAQQVFTRADLSIVCWSSGGLDWIVARSHRHVIHDSLRPGAEIIDSSNTPKPGQRRTRPKPLPNRR